MSLKFITPEQAAEFIHHDDNVGFSGFTPAGSPKVVAGAIAAKAEAEHAAGREFKIGVFTGASTGDTLGMNSAVSMHIIRGETASFELWQ